MLIARGANKKRLANRPKKNKRLKQRTRLTQVDGGLYVVLHTGMHLGALLQLHIRFRRPQRLVLPQKSQQFLHRSQSLHMRLGELVDGLRKYSHYVPFERYRNWGTYLALLQPQIVVELQGAAQFLGQVLRLYELEQPRLRQHQGLLREHSEKLMSSMWKF